MNRHLTSKALVRKVERKVDIKTVDQKNIKMFDQKMISNDRPGVAFVALAITVGFAENKILILII